MNLLDEAESLCNARAFASVISLRNPFSVCQRVYGYFTPLISGKTSFSVEKEKLSLPLKYTPPANCLIVSPETLVSIHHAAGEKFAGQSPSKQTKLKKAETVGFKRKELLAQNSKLPVGLRLNYFFLQKGLYSAVRKFFGKSFRTFLVDEGEIPAATKLFFEDAGFEILQPEMWGKK